MPIITPTPPTTPPPIPQRADRSTFSARVDAGFTWFVTLISEVYSLAQNAFNNATEAATSAGAASTSAITATTQATNASNSANAAAATAGATLWVSGTSYTAYTSNVISPANGKTYRRLITGAGTTDPSLDATNWVGLGSTPLYYLKATDQKTSGTNGGSSIAGFQVRTLNTLNTNEITGASLSSNRVTLPAGSYDFLITSSLFQANQSQLYLYSVTDSAYAIFGSSIYQTAGISCNASGRLTITSTKQYEVSVYANTAYASTGLGVATSSGQSEIYTTLEIWKVA